MSEQKLTWSAFNLNQLGTLSAITNVAQGDLEYHFEEVYYELFENFWNEVLDDLDNKISLAISSAEHTRDSYSAQGENLRMSEYATALALTYNEAELLAKLVGSMDYETVETHLNHFVKSFEEWNDISLRVHAMSVAWNYMHGEEECN